MPKAILLEAVPSKAIVPEAVAPETVPLNVIAHDPFSPMLKVVMPEDIPL